MMSRISGGMERMDTASGLLRGPTLREPDERRSVMVFNVRSSCDMKAREACMSVDGAISSC